MAQSNEQRLSAKALQIESTAETLFHRYGYKRVTIEEICQTADVSKMTFYKYFPNKEELYKHLMTKWYKDSESIMNELKAKDIPFIEKIREITRLKEESISRLSEAALKDVIHPEPELQAFMKDFYDKGIQLTVDFIRDAQDKGEIRKGIKPEFILAVLSKIVELAKDEHLLGLYANTAEYALEINNFFFCGVMPLEKMEGPHA